MLINNQLINRWVVNLEVVICIVWLLYFLNVKLPPPLPTLVNVLSYLAIAILVVLRYKHLAYPGTRDISLLIYVGIALASILWTGDPAKTLDAARGLLRMFLFGAYFTARFNIKEQIKILAWVFGLAAFLCFATAVAIPSYGIDEQAWTGIFPYKNYMGYTMSIAATLFLLSALTDRKRNWLSWIGFGLTLTLIVQARSAGSLVNVLTLLLLLPFYQLVKQHYKPRVILLGITCILVGSITLLLLNYSEIILVDILGKSVEFNGRTPVWELCIKKGLERFWLGYGLNAFWSSDAGVYVMIHTWSGLREEGFNSHNSFLEVFLNLGFLGFVVYLISLITVFIKTMVLLISTKKIEFFWYLIFIIFMCQAGMADTNFIMSPNSSYCCINVFVSLTIAVEMERMKRNINFQNSLLAE